LNAIEQTTTGYHSDVQRAVLQAENRPDGLEERALVYGKGKVLQETVPYPVSVRFNDGMKVSHMKILAVAITIVILVCCGCTKKMIRRRILRCITQ
jgi:hypothetical protein